jgi:hypothetical protein
MAVALACTLTQFDHFVLLAMTSSGSGRYVSQKLSEGTPLSRATWTPGPNPSTFFSRTGAVARREDKPPFKQLHQKGYDGGDCRTFTSDLLSRQVKYPQGLDEY